MSAKKSNIIENSYTIEEQDFIMHMIKMIDNFMERRIKEKEQDEYNFIQNILKIHNVPLIYEELYYIFRFINNVSGVKNFDIHLFNKAPIEIWLDTDIFRHSNINSRLFTPKDIIDKENLETREKYERLLKHKPNY